jgi:regulator of protease activity HflC (stomatin/prohibitin superfamily)
MKDIQEAPIVLANSPSEAPFTASENCLFKFLNIMVCVLGLGLPLCCGFFHVEPQDATLIDAFGKIVHVVKEPGLHWYWPFWNTKSTVSLKQKTFETKVSHVPDSTGSPLLVEATVTYSIDRPIEARYHINDL